MQLISSFIDIKNKLHNRFGAVSVLMTFYNFLTLLMIFFVIFHDIFLSFLMTFDNFFMIIYDFLYFL